MNLSPNPSPAVSDASSRPSSVVRAIRLFEENFAKHHGAFAMVIDHLISLAEDSPSGSSAIARRIHRRDAVGTALHEFVHERDGLRSCSSEARKWVVRTFDKVQEVVVPEDASTVGISFRPRVADWRYLLVHVHSARRVTFDWVHPVEFLKLSETLLPPLSDVDPTGVLEVDFGPFSRFVPCPAGVSAIGRGGTFTRRALASELFMMPNQGADKLLEYVQKRFVKGTKTLVREGELLDLVAMQEALREADDELLLYDQDSPADRKSVAELLEQLGFAPGWGNTVGRIRECMGVFGELLEAPSSSKLAEFLDMTNLVTTVCILSPHGYFGQEDVLGLPDTGGQIVYILDQVKAMEKELLERLERQGLSHIKPRIIILTRLIPDSPGTPCNVPEEDVFDTKYCQIVRVPFRNPDDGKVLPHWISRFEVWPFLDQFVVDAEKKLAVLLAGHAPELFIGNYSDGNLVAAIMARRANATLATIAHALEKTKYADADLSWCELDAQYHFSCQFNADLLAMNQADFIITSTFQEIAGNEEDTGQYEVHQHFTMPGLCRVVSGINVMSPRFNIVSPGADAAIYFPFTEQERRKTEFHDAIDDMLFGEAGDGQRGSFADKTKPIIFSMARLDRIKNLTGLARAFGKNKKLQEMANLFIIAGNVKLEDSSDKEERAEIELMHSIMDEYDLDDKMRWLPSSRERHLNGELYRVIADKGGVFAQPAIYEAFGLTVIEAMATGLPTFATAHGGPREIIDDTICGFYLEPEDDEQMGRVLADFFGKTSEDPAYWTQYSNAALQRVKERYNWPLYASTVISRASLYTFKRWIHAQDRIPLSRYIGMFHRLMVQPAAKLVARTDLAMKPSACLERRLSLDTATLQALAN